MSTLTKETKMTIKQMIKKANYVFVWVLVYGEDGEYIRVSKTAINFPLNKINDFDKEKFVLREDGDLYIN
jgi:hypothetical protein